MLIGHFGVGLAARRLAKDTPMPLLLAAPLFLDLLWPLLFFVGIERFDVRQEERGFLALELQHVPYTHGLLGSLVWSLLFGAAYYALRRDRRGALVLGALVFSHWLLDLVTHTPDLPLVPGSDVVVGLSLWASTWGTLVVEGALFAACVLVYARATSPIGRSGTLALSVLVAVLLVIYLHSLLGPPLPSANAMAAFAMLAWLAPLWGVWLDRRRVLVTSG